MGDPGRAVAAHPVERQAAPGGRRDDIGLPHAGRQPEHGLQAGRDAGDAQAGHAAGERGDEAVAAAPVEQPGPSHVPVVLAGFDQLGQGQLVQAAAVPVGQRLGRDDVGQEPARHHDPGQPDRWCQRLARRSGVDHVLGRQGLHGPDRAAVVAELPVVVVLDHDRSGPCGPPPGLRPAMRRQRHAERELMRRREQHGPGVADLVDHRPVVVHRDRPRRQAAGLDDVAVMLVAVGLHRYARGAPRRQDPAQQRQGLRESRADHDLIRRGAHPASPGQVDRKRGAQLGSSARV